MASVEPSCLPRERTAGLDPQEGWRWFHVSDGLSLFPLFLLKGHSISQIGEDGEYFWYFSEEGTPVCAFPLFVEVLYLI